MNVDEILDQAVLPEVEPDVDTAWATVSQRARRRLARRRVLLGACVAAVVVISSGVVVLQRTSDEADVANGERSSLPMLDVDNGGSSGLPAVSEMSDYLPTVSRQIGLGGPIERFASTAQQDDLFVRGRITDVQPWYGIATTLERSADGQGISDTGERRYADYDDPENLWVYTRVSFDITDDFDEPDFDEDQITARMRYTVEELEPFVGVDSLLFAVDPTTFDPFLDMVPDLIEWDASGVISIADDGTIAWNEHHAPLAGRSTTIDALTEIARRGEVVVTRNRGIPPDVIERRPGRAP